MSTDVAKSTAFYSELFGWKIEKEPSGPYSLITLAGSEHFGGMMAQQQPGAPSAWLPYFAVTDIDKAIAAVPAAGGKVHMPKSPIETTGWFAVVSDPQGAFFNLFQYNKTQPKPELDSPEGTFGHFCWDELLTSDVEGAKKFYASVVGWGAETKDMGGGMMYTLFLRDAKRPDGTPRHGGGLMQMPPGVPHPFWMSYVHVADCDQTAERAKKLGAMQIVPPMDIPGVGRFAGFMDNTMAAFSILGPSK